jgi:phosphoribosylformimino-5-aminoimidazole carboxamide ribotide isomerase
VDIIPVIDLKHGQVVHARRGDRASYAALASTICSDAVPLHVAAALIEFCSPRRIYIADLDAISGAGEHLDQIAAIQRAHPNIELWLDAGFRAQQHIEPLASHLSFVPVIGSETLPDVETFEQMIAHNPDAVVSLDFRGEMLMGPPDLLYHLAGKARRLLHLNLKHVGSSAGPDLAGIDALRKHALEAQIYCGGGVRNMDDLRQLDRMGVRGALLATALHDGSLAQKEVATLSSSR